MGLGVVLYAAALAGVLPVLLDFAFNAFVLGGALWGAAITWLRNLIMAPVRG
jgi:hypothetical protein